MWNRVAQLEAQDIPVHALLVSLGILVVAIVIDRVLQIGFQRTIRKTQESHHDDVATRLWLTRRLARVGLWIFVIALIAQRFETLRTLGTTLLASAGVVGVIVGVAARSTFANAVAGIQIAFTQPIRVGDVVNIKGETGEVEDITLTYTYIKTGDNRRLAIPNDVLSSEVIRNYSLRDPASMATAAFFVGYGADLDQVKAVLIEAARTCPALDPKREPGFGVTGLQESSVKVSIFAWARTPMASFDLGGQLNEAGLRALQKAKVPLPSSVVRQLPA